VPPLARGRLAIDAVVPSSPCAAAVEARQPEAAIACPSRRGSPRWRTPPSGNPKSRTLTRRYGRRNSPAFILVEISQLQREVFSQWLHGEEARAYMRQHGAVLEPYDLKPAGTG
jgi:hypothetical protein